MNFSTREPDFYKKLFQLHDDTQDNNNINAYETRTKFNTTKWRPIYEVIDEAYIKF